MNRLEILQLILGCAGHNSRKSEIKYSNRFSNQREIRKCKALKNSR